MPQCAALGCRTKEVNKKANPPITLHRKLKGFDSQTKTIVKIADTDTDGQLMFPSDEVDRRKWAKAMGRENWEPTKISRLCSKHFKQTDFDPSPFYTKLKKGVVPSVFDPVSSQFFKTSKASKRSKPSKPNPVVPPPTEDRLDVATYSQKDILQQQIRVYETYKAYVRNCDELNSELRDQLLQHFELNVLVMGELPETLILNCLKINGMLLKLLQLGAPLEMFEAMKQLSSDIYEKSIAFTDTLIKNVMQAPHCRFSMGPLKIYDDTDHTIFVYVCDLPGCSSTATLNLETMRKHLLTEHSDYQSNWDCHGCDVYVTENDGNDVNNAFEHLYKYHSVQLSQPDD